MSKKYRTTSQKNVDIIIQDCVGELFTNILPTKSGQKNNKPSLDPKTRKKIAQEGAISDETLRTARRRGSMNLDTFLRILYARGVNLKKFVNNVRTNKFSPLLPKEAEWLKFGMKLNEKSRGQYLDLLNFLEDRWKK